MHKIYTSLRGVSMSIPLKGKVENVEIRGPFASKKTGKSFDVHEYTINGKKFSKFDFKQTGKSEAVVGDVVVGLFQSRETDRGTSNTLTELEVMGSSSLDSASLASPTTQESEKPKSKTKLVTKSSETVSSGPATSADETQMRISRSHAITAAINFLTGQNPTLTKVIDVAEQIKNYTLNGKS